MFFLLLPILENLWRSTCRAYIADAPGKIYRGYWQEEPINAPTVLNSSFNVAQFWDGRAPDLKAQTGGPIANPGEMAASHTLAVEVLTSIPEYLIQFKQVLGKDQITIDEVTQAIAEFEKTLTAEENAKIVAFLKALTGDQPTFLMPILPPSTDKTPPPKPFG